MEALCRGFLTRTGGRFDALAVKVMGVVVVDETGLLHVLLLPGAGRSASLIHRGKQVLQSLPHAHSPQPSTMALVSRARSAGVSPCRAAMTSKVSTPA